LDIFNEQLIKAAKSTKRTALKALFVFLCISAGLACVLFIPMHFFAFTLAIFSASIWLAWYLVGTQNVEYEYILTNTDLDIDKITAKRSRKRLISIKVTSFTDFKKADKDNETVQNSQDYKVIDVSGDSGDVYIAKCSHNSLGKIELRFTPNAEFAENLEKVFPRELKLKLRQNQAK
jgi:hypothetical protein